MSGEFLPPVVTELTGDIDGLVDAVNRARAYIKTLGNIRIKIPVDFDVNEASLNRQMAAAKAQAGKGIGVPLNPEANLGALARDMTAMQAMAARGITIPATVSYGADSNGGISMLLNGMRLLAAGQGMRAIEAGPTPLAITAGPGGSNAASNAGWLAAWSAATMRPGGNGRTPGGWGWLGNWPWGAVHAATYGTLGGLAALAGGAIDLGSLAAVWAQGGAQVGKTANYMNTAVSATIPPGAPDYPLAKAFGLNVSPNSPFALAERIGTGQVYSAYGGIVRLANELMGKGSFVSNLGLNEGMNLDALVARMDTRAMGSTGTLQKFAQLTSTDASNVGRGLLNILTLVGHIGAHMPGEVEWLTTGFRNVTSWANDIFSNRASSDIVGDAIWGAFLTHGVGEVMKYGSKGLSFLFKSGVGERLGLSGLAAEGGTLDTLGGMSIASMFTAPEVLIPAAAIGTALLAYRYQTPTSGRITNMWKGLTNVNAGKFAVNAPNSIGSMFGALQGASQGTSFLGDILGTTPGTNGWQGLGNGVARIRADILNTLTFGLFNKEKSPYQQYENTLSALGTSFIGGGNTWNQLAAALGTTPELAATMANMAGVKIGKNGSPVGGMSQAILMLKNYRSALGIFNGKTGETMANMGVMNVTQDSAWQDASTINSAWDSYMSAMTGGAGSLSGLLASIHKTPGLALNSFIGTSGAIMGSATAPGAEQLMDFFRQGQAVGAIGGNSIATVAAQIAASLAPIAGRSATARKELVALANEGGGDFKNMGQVMRAAGGSVSAALKGVEDSTTTVTAKMANLPPFAQTMAQAVTSNIDSMAESIVAKNANAKRAFDNLIGTMEKFPGNASRIDSAAAGLAGALLKDHMPISSINALLEQLGIQGYNAQKGLLAAWTAWGHIQSGTKTLTLQEEVMNIYAGVGANPIGPRLINPKTPQGKGHAFGVRNSAAGWALLGERGPEFAYLGQGSSVVPNHYLGQTMATAAPVIVHEHHHYMNGKEIFGAVKSETYQYNVNNNNRRRGGRVNGTMAPR